VRRAALGLAVALAPTAALAQPHAPRTPAPPPPVAPAPTPPAAPPPGGHLAVPGATGALAAAVTACNNDSPASCESVAARLTDPQNAEAFRKRAALLYRYWAAQCRAGDVRGCYVIQS
jgi:hypothetical protein